MLLDEPTPGLDPRSRMELWETIEGMVAEGTTVGGDRVEIVVNGREPDGVALGDMRIEALDDAPDHECQVRGRIVGLAGLENEAANLAKSEFLAAMSHELRTPMTLSPSTWISPPSGSSSPAMQFSVVDFPQPVLPSSATMSPLWISREMSSTARKAWESMRPSRENAFVTPSNRISTSDS